MPHSSARPRGSSTRSGLPLPSTVMPASPRTRSSGGKSGLSTDSSWPTSRSTETAKRSPSTSITTNGRGPGGARDGSPKSLARPYARTSSPITTSERASKPSPPRADRSYSVVSSTRCSGTPYSSPPTCTRSRFAMLTERGSSTTKVVPFPGTLRIDTLPPSDSNLLCTASRPTPRPDTSVASSRVETPGRKANSYAASSDSASAASCVIAALFTALRRSACASIPRPSSCTSTITLSRSRRAVSVSLPRAGLPAFSRVCGSSRPWSAALRTRCESGSPSASITVRSSSTSAPCTSSSMLLFSRCARSRTARGSRSVKDENGVSRALITRPCSSRAVRRRRSISASSGAAACSGRRLATSRSRAIPCMTSAAWSSSWSSASARTRTVGSGLSSSASTGAGVSSRRPGGGVSWPRMDACGGETTGGGGETGNPSSTGRAAGAMRTSTWSTSGSATSASRTSSVAVSVASSAVIRAPPFCCMSCAGVGSISRSVPIALSLRCTIRARAPGAAQVLASPTDTSSRGSDGSAAGITGGGGTGRTAVSAGSGSAWAALASRSTSVMVRSSSSFLSSLTISFTSASVAAKSRSTSARSIFPCLPLSRAIRFSAACAMSTIREKPRVAALPFTECMRRKIASHKGAAGGSCSSRTSSDWSVARCSDASATKRVRYLWEADGTGTLLAEHLLDHGEHVLPPERLHDEIGGAGLDRLHHQRFLAERAAHHHHRVGIELHDLAGGVDAALVGHHDVPGDQVGLQLAEEVDRLHAVVRFARDGEPRRREDVAQRVPHEQGVVDDQDALGHVSGLHQVVDGALKGVGVDHLHRALREFHRGTRRAERLGQRLAIARERFDARHLRHVQPDVPPRTLQHHHAPLRTGGARLEAHQRPQIHHAGDAALQVHHSQERRRSARHPGDGRHLRHPAHRPERQRVALTGVDADDGAH